MTAPLTYDVVLAEFEQLVATQPDRVYQIQDETQCLYVHGNEPGCIIAWWLHGIRGVALYELRECEGVNAAEATRIVLGYPDLTGDVEAFLERIQEYQDGFHSWSVALAMTLQYMQDAEDSAAVARNLAAKEAEIQV